MIAELSAAFSSVKAATELAKAVREAGLTLEQAEYKLKLAELIEKLADAKIEISSIQSLIDEKDRRINELKGRLEVRERIFFRRPFYWLRQAEIEDGPYCQHCWDSSQKLLRLQNNGSIYWHCTACKNIYEWGERSSLNEQEGGRTYNMMDW